MPASDDDLFGDSPCKSRPTFKTPERLKPGASRADVVLSPASRAIRSKGERTPLKETDLFSPRSVRSVDLFSEADFQKSPRLFASPLPAPLTPSQTLNRRATSARRSLFETPRNYTEELDDTVPLDETYDAFNYAKLPAIGHQELSKETCGGELVGPLTPPETQEMVGSKSSTSKGDMAQLPSSRSIKKSSPPSQRSPPQKKSPAKSSKGELAGPLTPPETQEMVGGMSSTSKGDMAQLPSSRSLKKSSPPSQRSPSQKKSPAKSSKAPYIEKVFKTPERCRPSTSKANMVLSPASRAIMKKFSCPEAAKNQAQKGSQVYKKAAPERDERVVRKRAERALLHGFDCRCCAQYYNELKLSPESRKKRIDEVSRHRGAEELPPTPPRYWELTMPSTQTQQQLGWVEDADSPLVMRPKVNAGRRLFEK
uniref:SAE2 domain-containing protein n=1 Tax=Steinernema glaseri TaxID=37863 RepID=A0A1I7YQ38_9BILA